MVNRSGAQPNPRPPATIGFRLWTAGALLFAICLMGTLGFWLIEGWNPIYALYVTVITATTVAFVDPRPLSQSGQIFNVFLAIFSVVAFLYILSIVLQIVVEGELGVAIGSRRLRRKVARLANHFIVCGYGRVGEEIARELSERSVPFVVVESNPEVMGFLLDSGHLYVEGDATQEPALRAARIGVARGLITASDSDSRNTYIALAARTIRPELLVVARAGQPANEKKLLRAGADRVINPYVSAGRRMALAAMQPLLADFLDTVAAQADDGQLLAEVAIAGDSPLANLTLGEALAGAKGLTVLGIIRREGGATVGPGPQEALSPGDTLIVFGSELALAAITRQRT